MALLRFFSILVLAIWVGGLIVLGALAAPTIFSVLATHDPGGGRVLGGTLFGAIFTRFQHLALALGVTMLALLAARAALGPRPRRMAVRMWTVAAMLTMSLATGILLTTRIDAIRDETAGAVADLPDTDPRKIEFGRLHGASNGLMLLTLVAGLGLLWAETRDGH